MNLSEHNQVLSSEVYNVTGCFLVLICLVASVGNILLLLVLSRYKLFHQPITILLINLSAADLFESLFAYIFSCISTFQKRWLFGSTGCSLYGFVCFLAALSNIWTHVAIAIYRYKCVCKPKMFDVNFFFDVPLNPKTSMNLVITSIWAYSFMWSILPFIGWGRYGLELFRTACSIKWHETDHNNFSYTIVTFITVLIVPVAIMFFCYVKMGCHNKQQRNNVNPLELRSTRSACSSAIGSERTDCMTDTTVISDRRPNMSVLELRTNFVISVTMVLFFVAWLPYGVLSLMVAFGYKVTPGVSIIPVIMAKSQSAVNPIVMVSMHSHVRKAIKVMLLKNPVGLELPVADEDVMPNPNVVTRMSKF